MSSLGNGSSASTSKDRAPGNSAVKPVPAKDKQPEVVLHFDGANDDDDDVFDDYVSAMDSALEARNGDGDSDDNEETSFVYTGRDDEEMQELQLEAAKESNNGYAQRMAGILDDDEGPPWPPEPAIPSSKRSPDSPPTSLVTLERAKETPISPSPSSTFTFNSSRPRSGTLTPQKIPLRRPAMNPLVSRLRSTSGAPSISHSNSLRSVSQATSATMDDLTGAVNGFANDTPNASFLIDRTKNGSHTHTLSRQSSAANLHGLTAIDAMQADRHLSPGSSDVTRTSRNNRSEKVLAALGKPHRNISQPVTRLRWTPLQKLSQRLRVGRSTSNNAILGEPTVMAVGGVIAIGTSKGWSLVFDYTQSLRCVCGNEVLVKKSGRVTALAVSTDHTFVAVGHETGYIHVYALAKSSQPYRSVSPTTLQVVEQGKAEGHLAGSSIVTHLHFVGDRHTALVSGDQIGLAFYHSLGKILGLASTDVLRILGKYPPFVPLPSPPPTSRLLAAQPLPLGSTSHPSDAYALVALMTATKLVVAGLKPSARTWWRHVNAAPLPEVSPAGSTGCLAWLPSVDGSEPLLAFAWSAALHIVKVVQRPQPLQNGHQRADNLHQHSSASRTSSGLTFVSISEPKPSGPDTAKPNLNATSLLNLPEPIENLQWLSHKTLLVAASQHIYILDLTTLAISDSLSWPWQSPSSGLGIVPCLSFQTYKNRVFILKPDGVSSGALLSWTDIVLQLVNDQDVISAIDFTVGCLTGDGLSPSQVSSLGLSADPSVRREAVKQQLRSIVPAAADYVFSEDRMHRRQAINGIDDTAIFESLVDTTALASIATQDFDFLFGDLFDRYHTTGIVGIFLQRIEPFIISKSVTDVPTSVIQLLLKKYEVLGDVDMLAQLMLGVKPECLDVNQAVEICTRFRLWDPLIHVYNQALQDFLGPLIELVKLMATIQQLRDARTRWSHESMDQQSSISFQADDHIEVEGSAPDAYKAYEYLADSLIGLNHITKQTLPSDVALRARRRLWSFLLSRSRVEYPPGTNRLVKTRVTDTREPPYPYLNLLLRFDAEALLGCLDIAFEDAFLDDIDETSTGHSIITRQQIADILLEITTNDSDVNDRDRTYVNIFLSRNLPKYSQFLRLDSGIMTRILSELASDADLSSQEDRELAAEYLVSAFRPEYTADLLGKFHRAGFFRLLAFIYNGSRQFDKLAALYVDNVEDTPQVLEKLAQVLQEVITAPSQRDSVEQKILSKAADIVDTDVIAAARFFDRSLPSKHTEILFACRGNPMQQLAYLRSLLSDDAESTAEGTQLSSNLGRANKLLYVALLCEHDVEGVIAYLAHADDEIKLAALDVCRAKDVPEALIWYHAQSGNLDDSVKALTSVLQDLSQRVTSEALNIPTGTSGPLSIALRAARVALSELAKASVLGINFDREAVFIELIASFLNFTHNHHVMHNGNRRTDDDLQELESMTSDALMALVALSNNDGRAFPRLFRKLVTKTTATSYAEWRNVISKVIDSYRFESDLLEVTCGLVKADLYVHVEELAAQRDIGWRPASTGICEVCGMSIWAANLPEDRFDNLQLVPQSASGIEVGEKLNMRPNMKRRPSLKGKETNWHEEEVTKSNLSGHHESIVVFRGQSTYHALCLQNAQP